MSWEGSPQQTSDNLKQKQPDTHVHHNEKWWQTVCTLKAGINIKYPPPSMSHFPVISVLDWISTKTAKHFSGLQVCCKRYSPGMTQVLWVAMQLNDHASHFSHKIHAGGCCLVKKRGLSLLSIHHCSAFKLTVFSKVININNFNWTAVQLCSNKHTSNLVLFYLFMLYASWDRDVKPLGTISDRFCTTGVKRNQA